MARPTLLARAPAVTLLFLLSACVLETLEGESAENLAAPGDPLYASGHSLVSRVSGRPAFLIADTAWQAVDARRADIVAYLDARQAQGFNAVLTTFGMGANDYGDRPFGTRADGRCNVNAPLQPAGANPDRAAEYDYWDNAEYLLREAGARDMTVVVMIGAAAEISGSYTGGSDPKQCVETPALAYALGRAIGYRFRGYRQVMMYSVLDDRAPVYGTVDKRPHYRALAEGLNDGALGLDAFDGRSDYAGTRLTALPRKSDPSSSHWFHDDRWIDFNSIQAWPDDAITRLAGDFTRAPARPTWVMENRYENYTAAWNAWSQRYQLYLAAFSGAFGVTYGEQVVCIFNTGWRDRLNAVGARQVRHLGALMNTWSDSDFLGRVPDQSLLVSAGTVGHDRVTGNRQQAIRSAGSSLAMVYAMDGRNIGLRMSRLTGPSVRAYWYSPRTGRWVNGAREAATRTAAGAFATPRSGAGAPDFTFDPPGSAGADRDWVLFLETTR